MANDGQDLPLKQIAFFDVLPFLCRLIGFALLLCAAWTIGLPPPEIVPTSVWLEGAAGCFFLLLPSAKKISLGKLLTFEREVEKIKEEEKETRETVMNFLSVYSTMIATISNTVNQTVKLSFDPAQRQRDDAKEKIRDVEDENEPKEDEVQAFVSGSGGDYNFALARVRIEMERELQDYTDSHPWQPSAKYYVTSTTNWRSKGSYVSIGNLFENFLAKNPHLSSLRTPYRYVLDMCNAAIHGRRVEATSPQI